MVLHGLPDLVVEIVSGRGWQRFNRAEGGFERKSWRAHRHHAVLDHKRHPIVRTDAQLAPDFSWNRHLILATEFRGQLSHERPSFTMVLM
jgi:hypothetical protein